MSKTVVSLEGLNSLKIMVSVLLAERRGESRLLNSDVQSNPTFLSNTYIRGKFFSQAQDLMHRN